MSSHAAFFLNHLSEVESRGGLHLFYGEEPETISQSYAVLAVSCQCALNHQRSEAPNTLFPDKTHNQVERFSGDSEALYCDSHLPKSTQGC